MENKKKVEDITTELKLKIAQLENEKRLSEEKCIGVLKESDRLMASLMIDVATYKNKLERVKKLIKELHDNYSITSEQYIKLIEEISD